MSHRRTQQERARIREERKKEKKTQQEARVAEEVAKKEVRERISDYDPDELAQERQECFIVWREIIFSFLWRIMYIDPFLERFTFMKPTTPMSPSEQSKFFKWNFPFLAKYQGPIVTFAIDYSGTPIVNGLPPTESGIPEDSWKAFLHERTLIALRLWDQSLLDDSDHPLAQQLKRIQERVSYDEQGNVSFIWKPAETEMLDAHPDSMETHQKLVELEYGENLALYDVRKADSDKGTDWVFLSSTSQEARCPVCGKITRKKCGTYERVLDDIPSRPNVRKRIKVKGRVYQCETCAETGVSDTGEEVRGYFRERLALARPDARRTNRLDALILMQVSNGSFHNAQRCLQQMGITVGDDAIRDLIMGLQFDDDPCITAIGVDDVSLRKGQRYATVIYDLRTHRLLCVLPGRDGKELRTWLEGHPKVRIIARDRGSAYAKAIDTWAEDHGITDEVVQIADRFHLIQNFIDHVKDHCKGYLPMHIAIDRETGELLDTVPTKVATAKLPRCPEEQMDGWDYTNEPVLDENGNPIVINLIPTGPEISDAAQMTESQKKQCAQSEQKRIDRYEKYKAVRDEYKACPGYWGQYKELAKKYGLSIATVKKYCQMSEEDFEACWGSNRDKERKHRTREIDSYLYVMYKMFKAGLDIGQVFWYVRYKGFEQADSTLVHYVIEMYKSVFPNAPRPLASDYLKLEYPENVYVVTKSNLIKYFLTVNPDTKKDELITKCEEAILEKYPNVKLLRDYFVDYHSAIMGDNPEAIESFAAECRIPEFQGFHDALRRDMKAVKAAVEYTENSGFVEGGNNKYKTILKLHYGRLKLETLNQACVFSSWHARPNFQLSDVLWWYPA